MIRLRTIDAHAEGGPLRLVVEGFPAPRGRTMLDKSEWVARHAAHLRRALVLEPRGHADMIAAILTEPVSPGSHAGLVFLTGEGSVSMCGHGVIAATTIVLERGLLRPGGDGETVVYDTAAGVVRARAEGDRVAFLNVPSFVVQGGVAVRAGARQLRADVAFGGVFYAIVDGEAAGLAIDRRHVPELRRAGVEITRALDAVCSVAHPGDPRLRGLHGTIFTAPPSDARADLRSATVFGDGQMGRSPSGTGTAAVMAVLDAMGLLAGETPFVHEGLIGTRFRGRVAGRTLIGDRDAIVPEVEGSAWITGEHTFIVSDGDPLGGGIRV